MSAEVESEVAASEGGAAAFERILLKLSGEALLGNQEYGIDLARVEEIRSLAARHAFSLASSRAPGALAPLRASWR